MEDIERMAKLEQKVENIEQGIQRIEDVLKNHIKQQDEKFENLTNKFSAKWVEKVVLALSILAITGVFTVLIEILKS